MEAKLSSIVGLIFAMLIISRSDHHGRFYQDSHSWMVISKYIAPLSLLSRLLIRSHYDPEILVSSPLRFEVHPLGECPSL